MRLRNFLFLSLSASISIGISLISNLASANLVTALERSEPILWKSPERVESALIFGHERGQAICTQVLAEETIGRDLISTRLSLPAPQLSRLHPDNNVVVDGHFRVSQKLSAANSRTEAQLRRFFTSRDVNGEQHLQQETAALSVHQDGRQYEVAAVRRSDRQIELTYANHADADAIAHTHASASVPAASGPETREYGIFELPHEAAGTIVGFYPEENHHLIVFTSASNAGPNVTRYEYDVTDGSPHLLRSEHLPTDQAQVFFAPISQVHTSRVLLRDRGPRGMHLDGADEMPIKEIPSR